jgi:hypothetical protein
LATNLFNSVIAPLAVAAVIAGGGTLVNWGAFGAKVEAHESRIHEIEKSDRRAGEDRAQMLQRVTAVETKLDILMDHFGLGPRARGAPP